MNITPKLTHTYADRSSWESGPWDDEPDHIEWRDALTNLPCLIHRNQLGALCGYVGVPTTHPLHGIDTYECGLPKKCKDDARWCDHTPDHLLSVHGGITYASECQKNAPTGEGICHVPDEGEPDNVWWLGFDCAHCFDIVPGMVAYYRALPARSYSIPNNEDKYCNVDYVADEVTKLASQLNALALVIQVEVR